MMWVCPVPVESNVHIVTSHWTCVETISKIVAALDTITVVTEVSVSGLRARPPVHVDRMLSPCRYQPAPNGIDKMKIHMLRPTWEIQSREIYTSSVPHPHPEIVHVVFYFIMQRPSTGGESTCIGSVKEELLNTL